MLYLAKPQKNSISALTIGYWRELSLLMLIFC